MESWFAVLLVYRSAKMNNLEEQIVIINQTAGHSITGIAASPST
jgi:hypothetical protein